MTPTGSDLSPVEPALRRCGETATRIRVTDRIKTVVEVGPTREMSGRAVQVMHNGVRRFSARRALLGNRLARWAAEGRVRLSNRFGSVLSDSLT
jgi:hypothetical protein